MNPHHRALADVVASVGGTIECIEPRAKHFRMIWTRDGRRHITVISATPSDRRALANARALIRRQAQAKANGAYVTETGFTVTTTREI